MTIPDPTDTAGPADPADPADTAAAADPVSALRVDVDAIVALERTIRAAQAEQLRLIHRAHGYAHAVEGVHDGSTSEQREFATRAFIAELATALVIPEGTASALVGDAGVGHRHHATVEALATGSIGMSQARSIFDALIGLPPAAAAALESAALALAPRQTSPALRRRLRSIRERLHPEPLDLRHRAAIADRRVILEPAPDGMAWLSLFLEAERAHAIKHRLDTIADTTPAATTPVVGADAAETATTADAADAAGPAAPDSRTHAQRVLDAAADLLLTGIRTDHVDRPIEGDAAILPRVLVTVPVLTLLGHSDEPAELDGYGPIDADTARRLAAHAPSFQRILTHPETGAYLSYGRTRYRVPADLAGYLRVRDGTCRFPGCNRRAEACDFDHTTDWARGGTTCAANIAVLCRKHHRLKHRTRWRITQEPGGVIRWTSPAGRDHTSQPVNPFLDRPGSSALRESDAADEHADDAEDAA